LPPHSKETLICALSGFAQKCKYTNHSAKGAEYDSQGQREARRPWVTELKAL